MSHTRRKDQDVAAFSASLDLLGKADDKAKSLGMSRSGYLRYCLAKELGFPDSEAKAISLHGAIQRASERVLYSAKAAEQAMLNDSAKPSLPPSAHDILSKKADDIRRKRGAGGKGGPGREPGSGIPPTTGPGKGPSPG